MELGNLLFGNSRGKYEIFRGEGWEKEFARLMRVLKWENCDPEFENDVFCVQPYYWGNCTCGFTKHKFSEGHREDCFQSELDAEKLKAGWQQGELGLETNMLFGERMKKEIEIAKTLYNKRGWDTKSKGWWYGCAVRCDCDYDERYENWLKEIDYPDGHKKECLLVEPNFLYKPTGFEIQWYKYPFRDSYMNQDISLSEFKTIINQCIKSLKISKGTQSNA